MNYICFSGGAIGADSIFSQESIKKGFNVIDYSFDGHNTNSKNRVILNNKQLKDGFEKIKITNKRLNRNINNLSSYVKNLLARDWYQVKNSDTIFAIGLMNSENTVAGGTGYAVSMAVDEKKPIFLFEQNHNQWYYYDYQSNRFEIYEEIPKLTKKFTGIGTRKINNNGICAIITLFKNIL